MPTYVYLAFLMFLQWPPLVAFSAWKARWLASTDLYALARSQQPMFSPHEVPR